MNKSERKDKYCKYINSDCPKLPKDNRHAISFETKCKKQNLLGQQICTDNV